MDALGGGMVAVPMPLAFRGMQLPAIIEAKPEPSALPPIKLNPKNKKAALDRERSMKELELRRRWDKELSEDTRYLSHLSRLREQCDREHRQQIEHHKTVWASRMQEIQEEETCNLRREGSIFVRSDRRRMIDEVVACTRQQQLMLREISINADKREREFEHQLKDLNARLENRARGRARELASLRSEWPGLW
eukprot:m51a1_g14045 hypothetical protein (193) ;mRNA; f:1183189-1183925